ncbi:DUF308 domain-containing protein [Methanobrevibacter sp.]|uniref:DUF308 domain-containing protein n=1 Tax=Methanobrevibacter sp. TaxID=66852 RepID=UPI0025FFA9D8|nr:DUF308 domain-containing protein [Methanobrevibacter sp.]MBR4448164.1 DUF308 domain-containing protein [Methanobrevibacter sp.]
MNYKQILGIIFIILGLLFIVYPLYSAEAVSLIAGICLIAFGFASIIDGFSVWSIVTHVSAINILLGICAILLGLLFIYKIDALSFIIGYQFYLIAFILIFIGLVGFFPDSTVSKATSILILIMGIVAIFLAFFAIAEPLYTAIIVGICLIMEGISFFAEDIIDRS